MTLASIVAGIRNTHQDCCMTDRYEDEGCVLDMRGLQPNSLTGINGSNYQSNHRWQGRLCDRIIIGQSHGSFVCAVELKGGRNITMSDAIKQIQGGLDLAASLLQVRSPDKWYPLLAYSGSMTKRESTMLRRIKVSYRGGKALVDRIACGSTLLAYLNRQ